MNIAKNPDRFYQLLDEHAEVERVADGFEFTEGPVWNPREARLYFSDIPGDTIHTWDEADGVQVFRRPSHNSNGLTLDAQGRLIACEHGSSHVTRQEPDGEVVVIASHYQGRELNSPNDAAVRSDGAIYFTDPPYGRNPEHGVERDRQLDFQGVYRIPPEGGEPRLLVDDLARPNGICFSPDERLLYVDDTERMHVRVFEVAADGSLLDGRVFFEETRADLPRGVPDGMKADEHGDVYCTGPGGIWVAGPDGEVLGIIRTPESAANLNWGGPDWNTLYITATHGLYRVQMKVRGAHTPYMG